MWKQISSAFEVDRLIFSPPKLNQQKPEEYNSIPDALISSECHPVFMTPDKGIPLSEYTHPDQAIYVFGNAQDDNLRWVNSESDIVCIRTPAAVDFFGISAVAIVLYDRLLKEKSNGNR